jgi:hypothetical protein
VKATLQKAGQELAKAGQDLGKTMPKPANEAQGKAVAQMHKALDALKAAQAAMAKAPAPPAPGTPGPPEPGQAPAPAQAAAAQPGKGLEKNEGKGSGDRQPDAQMANAKSKLNDVQGEGSFLQLPPRQRELIRQALSAPLPPEYSALIRQYYINIARGRPAATPAAPTKR